MSEACHPILRYGGWTSRPGVPAGTRMVLVSPGPVRAAMVMTEVIGVPELVMKAFSPSITHSSSPSSAAFVRSPAASLPASGSVRPKAASARAGAQIGEPAQALLLGAEAVDRGGARARPRPRG